MTTCISSSSVVGLRLTRKQTFQSAIWKSWKMKLAFLIVATLALVCSSWATNAEDEDKDIKLPGKIEWYDTPTFGWSYTIAGIWLLFHACQNYSPWKEIQGAAGMENGVLLINASQTGRNSTQTQKLKLWDLIALKAQSVKQRGTEKITKVAWY